MIKQKQCYEFGNEIFFDNDIVKVITHGTSENVSTVGRITKVNIAQGVPFIEMDTSTPYKCSSLKVDCKNIQSLERISTYEEFEYGK